MMVLCRPTLLKDVLYNCNKSETAHESTIPKHPYAQGVVVGVVSTLMAQGLTFEEAFSEMVDNLPKDFDAQTLPNCWRVYYDTEKHKREEPKVEPKTFEVVEYVSFFAVRHVATGKEHPMGDGVDSLFDLDGNAVTPGTEGFCDWWTKELNANIYDTYEAYFPELMEEYY